MRIPLLGIHDGRDDRKARFLSGALTEAGHRIRAHLDTEQVLRTTLDSIRAALPSRHVSIWLTTGDDEPRLALEGGSSASHGSDSTIEAAVARGARARRAVRNKGQGILALPVVAPNVGLVGVICISGSQLDSGEEGFFRGVCRETGFAVETASLYEQALAAKEKAETILSRVGDGVVVTDLRGMILDWNPATERMVGCPAAKALGRRCDDVLDLRMGEKELDCSQGCALLRPQSDAESVLGIEVWRMQEDGRRQPLLANVSAVSDPDGNVAEVVHSFRDVTRLKEADEAKTLFLATASHELRTPLTVIQGFSELLSRSLCSTEEERQTALEAIERRAVELNGIVDRLLLSSRIEAGRAEVDLAEADVAPVLRERVESLAASTGRAVKLEIAEELPAAHADPQGIATVLDHLLDNGAKYSPDGSPIAVKATFDDTWIRVSVTDKGIGMHAEQAARCFEKFWQGESSDIRRFGGTGIGLFIVHSLVEAMGGEISVESELGKGSTFALSLRREGAAAPLESQAEEALEPGLGEQSIIREFMRQIGVPARSER